MHLKRTNVKILKKSCVKKVKNLAFEHFESVPEFLIIFMKKGAKKSEGKLQFFRILCVKTLMPGKSWNIFYSKLPFFPENCLFKIQKMSSSSVIHKPLILLSTLNISLSFHSNYSSMTWISRKKVIFFDEIKLSPVFIQPVSRI